MIDPGRRPPLHSLTINPYIRTHTQHSTSHTQPQQLVRRRTSHAVGLGRQAAGLLLEKSTDGHVLIDLSLPSLLPMPRYPAWQTLKVGEQPRCVPSGHDGATTGHGNCLSDLARARRLLWPGPVVNMSQIDLLLLAICKSGEISFLPNQ